MPRRRRHFYRSGSVVMSWFRGEFVGINHAMVFVAMAGRVEFASVHGCKGIRVDRVIV